jgi:cytochrome oxidase assembly protein ShyY1
VLRTLRQPRYAALGGLMVIVALVCVAAGTWQIARFEQKRHANDDLRANARVPVASVSSVLPLVGQGQAPSTNSVEFRTIQVTGRYQPLDQTLVRSRTVNDATGWLVVTPLRTPGATLLVVRGFLPQTASGLVPVPAAAPLGTVAVTGRVESAESRNDAATQLSGHQVESINPTQQAARLRVAMYNGYVDLETGQPGTRGLQAIPAPDLSNPAGGALEPQHFAYIVQWYLFALLALAAPFAMARAERKHHREDEFDAAPAPSAPPTETTSETVRAAKLADRYGRPVR